MLIWQTYANLLSNKTNKNHMNSLSFGGVAQLVGVHRCHIGVDMLSLGVDRCSLGVSIVFHEFRKTALLLIPDY